MIPDMKMLIMDSTRIAARIMMRFSKTLGFIVKYRIVIAVGVQAFLAGRASFSVIASLFARPTQRQKAEARVEADKKDDELRQKWAGNVGPDYWK